MKGRPGERHSHQLDPDHKVPTSEGWTGWVLLFNNYCEILLHLLKQFQFVIDQTVAIVPDCLTWKTQRKTGESQIRRMAHHGFTVLMFSMSSLNKAMTFSALSTWSCLSADVSSACSTTGGCACTGVDSCTVTVVVGSGILAMPDTAPIKISHFIGVVFLSKDGCGMNAQSLGDGCK